MGLQTEVLKISDIKNILEYMIQYYKEKANDAGMDCGGEYEYEEWMGESRKVEGILLQLRDMKDIWVEQIPVHFQLSKLHGVVPAFDLEELKAIIEQFYNVQDFIFQEVKQNMKAAQIIMKYLEKSDEYV